MRLKKMLLIALVTGMPPASVFAETSIKVEDKTIIVTCDAQAGSRKITT